MKNYRQEQKDNVVYLMLSIPLLALSIVLLLGFRNNMSELWIIYTFMAFSIIIILNVVRRMLFPYGLYLRTSLTDETAKQIRIL